MQDQFWDLAAECANRAGALTNLTMFLDSNGVHRAYSPDEIKKSAGDYIYPLVDKNDPGWVTFNGQTVPNCAQPLRVSTPAQSFTACIRVYTCGYAAASCGRELAQSYPGEACERVSALCLAENPVPQMGAAAESPPPPLSPYEGPGTVSARPVRQSGISGPSGPGGSGSGAPLSQSAQ